jgi:hypothetical protein
VTEHREAPVGSPIHGYDQRQFMDRITLKVLDMIITNPAESITKIIGVTDIGA